MKPHVTLHMMSSIDGRIITSNWPKDLGTGDLYDRIHGELAGDAWAVGRATMAEFAKGSPSPISATENFPRQTWKASPELSGPYSIGFDRHGKLHLNRGEISGDALVLIVSEAVSDDYLAELRRDGISYVFAGQDDIDLNRALAALYTEFGVRRLLLEGGGGINGAFLAAGLIDEISLLLMPVADGTENTQTVFDRVGGAARKLELQSVAQLENGIVHLRYKVGRP